MAAPPTSPRDNESRTAAPAPDAYSLLDYLFSEQFHVPEPSERRRLNDLVRLGLVRRDITEGIPGSQTGFAPTDSGLIASAVGPSEFAREYRTEALSAAEYLGLLKTLARQACMSTDGLAEHTRLGGVRIETAVAGLVGAGLLVDRRESAEDTVAPGIYLTDEGHDYVRRTRSDFADSERKVAEWLNSRPGPPVTATDLAEAGDAYLRRRLLDAARQALRAVGIASQDESLPSAPPCSSEAAHQLFDRIMKAHVDLGSCATAVAQFVGRIVAKSVFTFVSDFDHQWFRRELQEAGVSEIRALVDTNVLISYLLEADREHAETETILRTISAQLQSACPIRVTPVVCEQTVNEMRRVLDQSRRLLEGVAVLRDDNVASIAAALGRAPFVREYRLRFEGSLHKKGLPAFVDELIRRFRMLPADYGVEITSGELLVDTTLVASLDQFIRDYRHAQSVAAMCRAVADDRVADRLNMKGLHTVGQILSSSNVPVHAKSLARRFEQHGRTGPVLAHKAQLLALAWETDGDRAAPTEGRVLTVLWTLDGKMRQFEESQGREQRRVFTTDVFGGLVTLLACPGPDSVFASLDHRSYHSLLQRHTATREHAKFVETIVEELRANVFSGAENILRELTEDAFQDVPYLTAIDQALVDGCY